MAGIIKSGELPQGAATLQSVAFNFEDMSDRAAGRLDIVRQQAEQGDALSRRKVHRHIVRAPDPSIPVPNIDAG